MAQATAMPITAGVFREPEALGSLTSIGALASVLGALDSAIVTSICGRVASRLEETYAHR